MFVILSAPAGFNRGINFHFETHRIGNEMVNIDCASGGNEQRAVPKEPARYALRNYKPLHLCMYQLPYPAADNARF